MYKAGYSTSCVRRCRVDLNSSSGLTVLLSPVGVTTLSSILSSVPVTT